MEKDEEKRHHEKFINKSQNKAVGVGPPDANNSFAEQNFVDLSITRAASFASTYAVVKLSIGNPVRTENEIWSDFTFFKCCLQWVKPV